MYSFFEDQKTSIHKIKLDNLDIFHLLSILTDLEGQYAIYKKQLNNFTGEIDIKLTDNHITNFSTKINSVQPGEINLMIMNEGQTINYQSIQCTASNLGNGIKIDNLAINLQNGEEINLKGVIDDIVNVSASNVNLDISVNNISTNNIQNYWPTNIAHHARKWVISSIKDGVITKGAGKVTLNLQSLQNHRINPGDIDIDLHFKDVSCNYHPDLPIITNISGIAHFSDHNIKVKAVAGNIGNETKIQNAEVNIPYIFNENRQITIEGESKGSLEDLVLFIPKFNNGQYMTYDMLSRLSGKVGARSLITIPLVAKLKASDIGYDIRLDIQDASFTQILPQYDLAAANIQGMFNGQFLTLNGGGDIIFQDNYRIKDTKLNIKLPILKSNWKTNDYYIEVGGHINASAAKKILNQDFITGGTLYATNRLLFNKNQSINFTSQVNLFNTELIWDDLGLKKRRQVPLDLTLSGEYVRDEKN